MLTQTTSDNPLKPSSPSADPVRMPPATAVITPRLRFSLTHLASFALFAAAFGGLFHYWFYVQNFQSWENNQDWGHAYFVPLVSLYLLWLKRAEVAALSPRPFWPGLLVVLLGVVAYALFLVGSLNNHMARGFAVILTLWGLILTTAGPAAARVAFWPVAYLIFAVTISERIMRDITFVLQLAASQGAEALLSAIGIPTERSGNVLHVANAQGQEFPLSVAEACAGMRTVIGFVALGAAVALAAARYWWQRVALLMLAVPIALLMNVGRVALLGILTLKDPELARGQAHMFVGTLLLIPAFLIYMALVWALNRTVHEPAAKGPPPPALADLWLPGPVRLALLARAGFVVPLLVLAGSAVAVPAAVNLMGIHLRKQPIQAEGDRRVQAIPTETESWTRVGTDLIESAEMIEELGTQNYLTRTYIERQARPGKAPRSLGLHLAYYTGMIDTIPHVPERCMVGGGWQITGAARNLPLHLDRSAWVLDKSVEGEWAGKIYTAPASRGSSAQAGREVFWSSTPGVRYRLPRNIDEAALRITEFTDPKSGKSMFAGYFFIANGAVTASAENVRLLAFDYRDYYAYYLKVQVSAPGFASAQDAAEAAASLLGELLPEIMRTVPDWVEVAAGRYPPGNPRAKSARAP